MSRKPTQIGFIPKKRERRVTKKEVIEILKAKGIDFNEDASLEELKALIPAE